MTDPSSISFRREWVFLDAGDTFIYAYPTLYEAIRDCWRTQGSDIEIQTIQEEVGRYLKRNPPADLNTQEKFTHYFRTLYREMLESLSYPGVVECGMETLWAEWETGKRLRLFEDALPALIRLRDAGFALGTVSNWDETFESVLERLGVAGLFQVILASCRIGIAKPNRGIFERALSAAGALPEQSWFLGDQPEVDTQPARILGMKTILVNYYKKKVDPNAADFIVPHLSAAVEIIMNRNLIDAR